jgi:hypothetical protein
MKKFLIFPLSLAMGVSVQAQEKPVFMAGAAKAVMTPAVETFQDANKNGRYDAGETFGDLNKNGKWDPVWLAGYQGGRYATGAHDDLWITALAMSRGSEPILFITVDLIGYLCDEVAQTKAMIAKELKIPFPRIFIFSTHDHSGPDAIGLWGPDGQTGKDQDYLNALRFKILACAKEALSARKPARAIFGKVSYGNPIEDSRPPKVINPLLLTMQLQGEDGKAIATLVNYAMHAEVLDGGNPLVTSDYPGVLREELEKRYGGVGMFIPADIGGMQSPFVLFHNFWSRKRVGKAIAEKVAESLSDKKPVDVTTFRAAVQNIALPIKNPRYAKAIESGQFGQSKDFLKKEGGFYHLPSDVALIQIGYAQFLTVPGEAFPEVGNVLRSKMSPEYPFVLGLANNEIGYIVPDSEWHDDGYEENMSLGRGTDQLLIQAISDLISRL